MIVLQLLWGLRKVLMNHLTTFFLFLLKKTEQNKYDLRENVQSPTPLLQTKYYPEGARTKAFVQVIFSFLCHSFLQLVFEDGGWNPVWDTSLAQLWHRWQWAYICKGCLDQCFPAFKATAPIYKNTGLFQWPVESIEVFSLTSSRLCHCLRP